MATLSLPIISLKSLTTASPKSETNFSKKKFGFAIANGGTCDNQMIRSASRSWIPQLRPRSELKTSSEKEIKKGYKYRFLTQDDATVEVIVRKNDSRYSITVSYLHKDVPKEGLVLNYGMVHSEIMLNSINGISSPEKIPLDVNSSGVYTIGLEFDESNAPFYLSFFINSAGYEIKTHKDMNFCVPIGIGLGNPYPLGVSVSDNGCTNFALFSKNAETVVLCLFETCKNEPDLEIELDPAFNRTGDTWHLSLESVEKYSYYGYRCKGPVQWQKGGRFHFRYILLDPYAKLISDFRPDEGKVLSFAKCIASLDRERKFDWSGDVKPCISMEKMVVYRLNVSSFTKDKSSGLNGEIAGTFAGIPEKVEHFKELGVNSILLEPVFSFDERKGPYFPYHFFSPMNSYGEKREGISVICSMKEMVKSMHKNGIEVLLEVCFSHTSEGGDSNFQIISFRGIDNSAYYIMKSEDESTLNCNNPIVQQLILDCLRYWVIEFHIDGFVFINSSSLAKNPNGTDLTRSPLIEAIAFDPVLSKTKIISDCSSPFDAKTVRLQFPHWKRWAEMNLKFCTNIRNFFRGKALISDLATRICGSGDVFFSRGPSFSFNYVTKNSGLPLVDLVSFSENKDLNYELSWNCGEEGPTDNSTVLETRLKQIRNFIFVLFISLGVPVLNMGDECGLSAGGSVNYRERKQMIWNSLKTAYSKQITQFIKYLTSLRVRRSDIFQRNEFLKMENIQWFGVDQSEPDWADPTCKFLSLKLEAEMNCESESKGDLFICFNGGERVESVTLPKLELGFTWVRLVDTSLSFPGFFTSESDSEMCKFLGLSDYEIKSHSCALFEAKRSLE